MVATLLNVFIDLSSALAGAANGLFVRPNLKTWALAAMGLLVLFPQPVLALASRVLGA